MEELIKAVESISEKNWIDYGLIFVPILISILAVVISVLTAIVSFVIIPIVIFVIFYAICSKPYTAWAIVLRSTHNEKKPPLPEQPSSGGRG